MSSDRALFFRKGYFACKLKPHYMGIGTVHLTFSACIAFSSMSLSRR
jgi:hypothetical protein